MGAAEQCWTAGRGYDPIGGVCVTRSSDPKDPDTLTYWDPEAGTMLTSPPIAVGNLYQIQWRNPAGAAVTPPAPVPTFQQPFGSAAGGIGDFLTQPGLLGFQVWTNIVAGAVLLFILSQMDGGGKKKGGGWI